ncbi:MAG: hypothetical protein GY803_18675 [Chloroflexi bacterium]|nr:hypothetical protein [Chloroflexota bacterium]
MFPEQFWNGDPNNDPRVADLSNSWPHKHKAGPRDYVYAATERWLAPNGRVQDGIDGWRLDVAFCVAHPFWKAFRQHVRSINPEAYTVGELVVTEGALEPYLQGDEFDAAMNYEFAVAANDGRLTLEVSTQWGEILRQAFPKRP